MRASIVALSIQPTKHFRPLIGPLLFSLASLNATAASVEYVCEPDESITSQPSMGGLIEKIDMSGAYTVILSLEDGNKGSSAVITKKRAPSFTDNYTVTHENGSIRWLSTSAGLTVYTLFTESMQMNHISQMQIGLPEYDGTMLTNYQCRLKL